MTKEELIQKLKDIDKNARYPEEDHEEADKLLLTFIDDEEVTDAFNEIPKWYA